MPAIRWIHDEKRWESFVLSQPYTLFVQSPHYGEFYRAMGEQSWILGIEDDSGALVGGSLIVSTHAKRGTYLFLPYGPILPAGGGPTIADFFAELRSLGKRERCDFIRISPFTPDTPVCRALFRSLGCRMAPMHALAETTWVLGIIPDENTLLADMNKNHRNLIRRCDREEVRVVRTQDPAALARFNALLDETTKRHRFHRFPRAYIEKEFAAFARSDAASVFEAYLPNGDLDASAIVIQYGAMSCYRHGASRGADKRLPASYALQWSAIQEAKRRGCAWYNFWGIAPPGAGRRHPFFGMTHFKTGFGGQMIALLPCHDIPLSPRYAFVWTIESLRRVRRGFDA